MGRDKEVKCDKRNVLSFRMNSIGQVVRLEWALVVSDYGPEIRIS